MTLDPGSALPSRPSPGAAGARLGELYTGNARMVYGLCRMLLDDPTEAEDATQQVFLSAYRSLLTGTEVDKPSAWLGTIARNECNARHAARSRIPVALHDAATLVSPGADEQALGRADAAELYSEVAALPASQRAAVVLRDIYGLRYDEVAAALGTSRPAVEALLFRGRRRLKQRLRPGLAAGVLVVPLSLHESLAYAVPGFVAASGPAAGLVAAPLLAKVAAVGAAAALAGSAGVVAERRIHDSPVRPADAVAAVVGAAAAQAAPGPKLDVPVRSLVSAATPLLDARVAAEETRDREDDEHDVGEDAARPERHDATGPDDEHAVEQTDEHDGAGSEAVAPAEHEEAASDESEPALDEPAAAPFEVDEADVPDDGSGPEFQVDGSDDEPHDD